MSDDGKGAEKSNRFTERTPSLEGNSSLLTRLSQRHKNSKPSLSNYRKSQYAIKVKKAMKKYTKEQVENRITDNVCFDCGKQFLTEQQKKIKYDGVTFHEGVCGLCEATKSVTSIRRYNYLRFIQPPTIRDSRITKSTKL